MTFNFEDAASADKRFVFTVETFYTRGNGGERTDTVTVFDTTTLRCSR